MLALYERALQNGIRVDAGVDVARPGQLRETGRIGRLPGNERLGLVPAAPEHREEQSRLEGIAHGAPTLSRRRRPGISIAPSRKPSP